MNCQLGAGFAVAGAGEPVASEFMRGLIHKVFVYWRESDFKQTLRWLDEFGSLLGKMKAGIAKFAEALASVGTLPVEDQAALVDVVNKRITAARRQEMVHEIAEARADYRRGNVRRGSATELMRELRGK